MCHINDVSSKAIPVVCGIPQGSNIVPLLFFNLYWWYSTLLKKLKFLFFTKTKNIKKTNIVLTGRDMSVLINNLNSELASLSFWFSANKLSIHIKKSNYVIFGSRKNIKDPLGLVLLDGAVSDRVFSTKFLGVLIDDKLNWKGHIKQVLLEITRMQLYWAELYIKLLLT